MLHIFPPPRHLELTGGEHQPKGEFATIIERTASLPREAFTIEVKKDRIQITGDNQGIAYAEQTIKQLLQQFPTGHIPCCTIRDEPSLEVRGFMLDCSRCRVPNLHSLNALIDLLGKLRYNQLQLYIEHTFAFKGHELVWKDASPFTPDELKVIDELCQERGIELVPNFNSFGHFERWLQHKPYKHLAECPEGFRREEPLIVRDHGGTLVPDQASIDFLRPLHAEFLQNFKSQHFNVGMDEPWELGQGWSKQLVEQFGKHNVYINHLKSIHGLVKEQGRKMMFWSDIILEKPELVPDLPEDVMPVIWGYEADHPFDEQCHTVNKAGYDYLVAPGTSTWNTFNGRLSNSLENIHSAIDNAVRHNAKGSLLTSWGDNGNHQPWPLLHPALFYHAQVAWNHTRTSATHIPDAIDHIRYRDPSGKITKAIFSLGNADVLMEKQLINSSPTFHFLFGTKEKLAKTLGDLEPRFLKRAAKHLNETRSWLPEATPACSDGDWILRELDIGIDLGLLGIRRAETFLETGKDPKLAKERKALAKRFATVWKYRAREGGLPESLGYILDPAGKII